MSDIDILSKISLFSLMNKRDLRRIAKLAHHHSFKTGELIVREGERDGRLLIIVSGLDKYIQAIVPGVMITTC